MENLEPPDCHFLVAALGWHELGLPAEAEKEVARIALALQEHPDVLEVRWLIRSTQQDWEGALPIAELLVRQAPERDSGWIHRAYSVRRVKHGGLQAAWDALRPAFEKFPGTAIIPYNLGCYAAQFGRLDEAWEWLLKAMAAGDKDSIKQMALADEDLQALWDRIRSL
jgi:hypothetical protein